MEALNWLCILCVDLVSERLPGDSGAVACCVGKCQWCRTEKHAHTLAADNHGLYGGGMEDCTPCKLCTNASALANSNTPVGPSSLGLIHNEICKNAWQSGEAWSSMNDQLRQAADTPSGGKQAVILTGGSNTLTSCSDSATATSPTCGWATTYLGTKIAYAQPLICPCHGPCAAQYALRETALMSWHAWRLSY